MSLSLSALLVRDRRVLGAVLAAVIFLFSWSLLDHGYFTHDQQIVDTSVYQDWGNAMRQGQLPYRDIAIVYPPASLPAFLAPTYVATTLPQYRTWFARLMSICGLACLGFVLLIRPPLRAIAIVALSPILVGQLVLSRFDLWPTALVAGALAALLRDRHRLAWAALAVGVGAKLFPLVLMPLVAVWTARRRGWRELRLAIAIWGAVELATFVPFAVIAPHGLWQSIWSQVSRPIQIESLVASYLTTFSHPHVVNSLGALAISGHGTLAAISTGVEVACLIALYLGFARGAVDDDRLMRYCAAAVATFIAFGKVLSPQFLIWLVPLVPLVRGRRGLAATLLLVAAMIDTQYWDNLPRYLAYVNSFANAWLVLARDLMLVAIVAVLALPAGAIPLPPALRRRAAAPSG